MDSLTHVAIGACLGEAFAGRALGKKAMAWGILAHSIPDIDFITTPWLSTVDNLLVHRGFTHSILFTILVSLFLSIIARRLHNSYSHSFLRWFSFLTVSMTLHIVLDAFNSYGVGWFEPFSHYRVSFNLIYVADPFFSIGPGVACSILLLLNIQNSYRKLCWRLGLGISLMYCGYCAVNKTIATQLAESLLANKKIEYTRFIVTPAPLQSWLWFLAAGNDTGYFTGYISVFDRNTSQLKYSLKNDSLLLLLEDKKEVEKLIRFSQQFYTIEQHADTILFNDLRFGQIVGWQNSAERFSFYYYLRPRMDNSLVVQRGRFAKWDRQSVHSFINRIKGN